jgi:hypothetical protein
VRELHEDEPRTARAARQGETATVAGDMAIPLDAIFLSIMRKPMPSIARGETVESVFHGVSSLLKERCLDFFDAALIVNRGQ